MSWTQPLCEECWNRENPGRSPIRVDGLIEVNICCTCGAPTTAGIWTRKNPQEVPYPA